MAITGAIIVMCGLSALAFIISQLHKVIGLFEKKKAATLHPAQPPDDIDILNDLAAAARLYQPMTADLGEKFPLSQLYSIFETESLPHPRLTIRALREGGYLVPSGEGIFCWKEE